MDNLKIRIPCKEVSRLVQEKAFEKGYYWGNKSTKVTNTDAKFLYFYESGRFYCGNYKTCFEIDSRKEVSWQEWVYGEGYFFKHTNYDVIFYQAKATKIVVWYNGSALQKDNTYAWEQYIGSRWYKTDTFGNKLEEKQMEKNVKLYDDIINVELTAEEVAKLRILLGEMPYKHDNHEFHKIYQTLCGVLPVSKRKYLGSVEAYTKSVTSLNLEVESLLQNNGYVKEAPKPVKEMTLADVCKELGYDVKIIKE